MRRGHQAASMVLPPPEYARRSGEIIASQLKKVGIEVEIVPMEWAQWLSDVFKAKNYDLTVISHVEPLDLDIYARDDYYFDYKNPAYKALIAELVHDLRPGEAAGALRQGAADAGRRRGQRVPLPAAQERRVERQAEGPVGQRADPRRTTSRRFRGTSDAVGPPFARDKRARRGGPDAVTTDCVGLAGC